MDGLWPPFPAHLEVKRSLIANAGDGLFAKRRIRKDKRIGKYRGVSYARKEASDTVEESHKPYLVSLGDGSFRDGYQMNNHMRWANHKSHIEGRDANDPNEPNAWLRLMEDKVVYVEALRDIEEGEEIYIDYGYDPVIPEEEPPRVDCELLSLLINISHRCINCRFAGATICGRKCYIPE